MPIRIASKRNAVCFLIMKYKLLFPPCKPDFNQFVVIGSTKTRTEN